MKAMILAAGLGTRLRPLTDTRPKALVEVAGRTLLEITLNRLRTFGITEVIVNVHHFADMVVDYLKSSNNFGMRIEISREDVLLDTGGGLKKAAWFFLEDSARRDPSQIHEPFLLHNVDVISNIDLRRMLQFHTENQALATLAVQNRETSRPLLFNDHHQLRGRRLEDHLSLATRHSPLPEAEGPSPLPPAEIAASCHSERSEESAFSPSRAGGTGPLQPLAFSGIHIISPRLLPMLTEEGVFSIIPSYLRLAAQGQKILAFGADQYYWRDLGRPADLAQAALDLQQKALL
jgi:mannose-1-phosphate guanylyltransferase